MLNQLSHYVESDIVDECIELCSDFNECTLLNQPTGNFFYDTWKIKNEYIGTAWQKLLESLPYNLGEARIIKLVPGETYMSHADIDNRWHLNLTGEQSYLIDLENKSMHHLQKDYKWYSMDASKIHVAANFGSKNRFQVVIRQLLTKSSLSKFVFVKIEPSREQHDYRYKFDQIMSPFLNKANKNNFLRNFQFEKNTVTFEIAEQEIENFKKIITKDFGVFYA